MITGRTSTPLRDVLYAFSLAKPIPDADLLEEFTRRYPEHASELTDFAIELAVDAVRGHVDAEPDVVDYAVSPAVARAMSAFQNRMFELENPASAAPAALVPSSVAPNPAAGEEPVSAAVRDTNVVAPPGHVWVCAACGKTSPMMEEADMNIDEAVARLTDLANDLRDTADATALRAVLAAYADAYTAAPKSDANKAYLGDAVYAAFDGGDLVLTTENWIRETNRVVLNPDVLAKLERYVQAMRAWRAAGCP